MVGRAAVRAPWIFAQARRLEAPDGSAPAFPETIDLQDTAHRFLDLLVRHQPPEFHPTRTRRYFEYFCENLKWSHHVKTLLARASTPADVEKALGAYFAEYPEERYYRIPRAALNPATT
jgi:tRNA-dihydrouridine synthase